MSGLETSLLSDIERLELELRRIETFGQSGLQDLVESKRTTKQDIQRLWDTVNDLQVPPLSFPLISVL